MRKRKWRRKKATARSTVKLMKDVLNKVCQELKEGMRNVNEKMGVESSTGSERQDGTR